MKPEAFSKKLSCNKKKRRVFLVLIVLVCILGAICIYHFYDFVSTERITGKGFHPGKPIESFNSPELSFQGDDCIVKIYRIPNRLEEHFKSPPPSFANYPLIPFHRQGWKSYYVKKWTKGIPLSYEASFCLEGLKAWSVPTNIVDKVETSLTLETSYYAYIGPGPGPRPGQGYQPVNFDFYILDPLNGQLIIIIYDM